jgi:hypothetical protein
MERIQAYHTLLRVKPPYQQLRTPFESSHLRRVQYNVRELQLHYRDQFGYYVEPTYPKRGGVASTEPAKILVCELEA